MIRLIFALMLAVGSFTAMPVKAQSIEYDLYDKADFEALLASKKPVIVHVNTTW